MSRGVATVVAVLAVTGCRHEFPAGERGSSRDVRAGDLPLGWADHRAEGTRRDASGDHSSDAPEDSRLPDRVRVFDRLKDTLAADRSQPDWAPTPDGLPPCGPACSGCCDGLVCREGTTNTLCGFGNAACKACAPLERCRPYGVAGSGGECTSCPSACGSLGCCDTSVWSWGCIPYNNQNLNRCGTLGEFCAQCVGATACNQGACVPK